MNENTENQKIVRPNKFSKPDVFNRLSAAGKTFGYEPFTKAQLAEVAGIPLTCSKDRQGYRGQSFIVDRWIGAMISQGILRQTNPGAGHGLIYAYVRQNGNGAVHSDPAALPVVTEPKRGFTKEHRSAISTSLALKAAGDRFRAEEAGVSSSYSGPREKDLVIANDALAAARRYIPELRLSRLITILKRVL